MTARPPTHVLITGGGGGLGAALAVEFANRGARVGLSGRNMAKLEAAAAACRGGARIAACDVTDADAMTQWLVAADDEVPVDCVIACAGVGGGDALAGPHGEPGHVARKIVDVNVQGVINAATPLLARMTARRSGRIVLVASLAGLIALPDSPAYCASKAAVVAYGEALRRLLRRTGVSVTVVCPGFVDTEMVRSLPMRPPFMWSADKAAGVIAAGVVRRRPMIVFPWPLRFALLASRVFPRSLVDRLLEQLRAEDFEK